MLYFSPSPLPLTLPPLVPPLHYSVTFLLSTRLPSILKDFYSVT